MEQQEKGGLSVRSSRSSSEDEEDRDTVPPIPISVTQRHHRRLSSDSVTLRLPPGARAQLAKMLSEKNVDDETLRDFFLKNASTLDLEEVGPVLERHNELRNDNETLKENQVKLHQDNDRLRRNQKLLGCTTALFGTLTIVSTVVAVLASKDTVVGSDGILSAKGTGRAVVTQSKGVAIVSEVRPDGPGDDAEAHECVRMEDVASLYRAFGDGTEARILAGDAAAPAGVTRVQGSGASVNDTHVTIGDVDFDIGAGNPCNGGGRRYPVGPRALFHEHLRRGLRAGREEGSSSPGGDDGDVYDAVIVGAGWAGVSAAAQLQRKGRERILLLEARDYIGGRSQTVTGFVPGAPDVPFERGSEFIYTAWPNDIQAIFANHEVIHEAVDFTSATFDPTIVTDGPSSLMADSALEEQYTKLWNNGFLDFIQGSTIGIGSNYETLFQDYEAGANLTNSQKQFLEAARNGNIVIEYGGDPDDVAVVGTYEWLTSVSAAGMALTSVPGGGYAKALDGFVGTRRIEEKVVKNAVVTEVRYGGEGPVEIDYEDKDGEVASVQARTVLVTAPLGVLKSDTINFHPPLPTRTLRAIDAMEVGVLDKLIMHWDDEAMEGAPDFKEGWDAVANKTWLDVITPETETSRAWTVFSNARRYNGLRTLTAWAGGSTAEAAEEMDDDAVVDVALRNLRLMFGDDVPRPTERMVTRWKNDPYARGSYSFRSVDVNFFRTARDLGRSVGDKVFFAGEHTSWSGWAGTCVGAFETGRRAANAMAASLSKDILVSVNRRG